MVKKTQKAKLTDAKPLKTTSAKAKKEKLNGFKDGESENETNESNKEIVASQKLQDSGSVERNDIAEASTSRKRKATEPKASKSGIKSTKAKKQKVLIEIPKLNSVNGKVFVCGTNETGQLGLDVDVIERKRPTLLDLPYSIVDIAAGAMHSVCLTENGEVITFGCNDEGALGRLTFEENAESTPQKVDIPQRIVQISAGDSHSAALSESGEVYIWGNFRTNKGSVGLVAEGTKQCTPIKILNNVTVVKISSGSDHLTCLSQEGFVYTCGSAEAGQLGRISEHASADGGRKGMKVLLTPDKVCLAANNPVASDVWTSSFATFVKTQGNGSIYAFGLNNYEQLGFKNPPVKSIIENPKPIFKPKKIKSFDARNWMHINGGINHTLALDDNGMVYSLGRSEYGMLGLEEKCDKSVPTEVSSLRDKKCVDISAGSYSSFAVTDDGSAFSWGQGDTHQLGHGNDSDQFVPKLIEGNFFNSWKAIKIAGGAQHTLILAEPRKTSENN